MTNKKVRRARRLLERSDAIDARDLDIKRAHQMPIPKRLELGRTPDSICRAYDVYFNGVKQRLCKLADVEKGRIIRYKNGIGNQPVAKGFGIQIEELFGNVEIRRKGDSQRQDPKQDDCKSTGTASAFIEANGSGIATGAAHDQAPVEEQTA